MHTFIQTEINKLLATLDRMITDQELLTTMTQIAVTSNAALRAGNKILLAGNGGSAADAQHIAAELVNRFRYNRPGIPAIALTTDSSALTSIGNDFGFEYLFSRQIEALGQKGDVFIAISTSGKSPNILKALTVAKERGLITIGLTGKNGGIMLEYCDHVVKVPSEETHKIQECHIMLGHVFCALIEDTLYPK